MSRPISYPMPHFGSSGPRVESVAVAGPEVDRDAGDQPFATISPLRKAAILLISLEQPLASKLLGQLDRSAVEAVTLEIARLERVLPEEQQAVLEEFYGLGRRRLRFNFDDLAKLPEADLRSAFTPEDAPTWALALQGVPRPSQRRVLEALGGVSAAKLQEALGQLGPFRLDDAEAAQAEVAERLRRLHDQGVINLPDPDGREEILV